MSTENNVNENINVKELIKKITAQEQTVSMTSVAGASASSDMDRWIEYDCEAQESNQTAAIMLAQTAANTLQSDSIEETLADASEPTGYNNALGYSEQNVGSNAVGRVNLSTGRVNMVYNDIQWNGNRLPVGIFHVYNQPKQNQSAGIFYPAGFPDDKKTLGMKFGKDWKINWLQFLFESGDNYIYCDEYATEYTLTKAQAQSGDGENGEAQNDKVSENIYKNEEKDYEYDKTTCILKKDEKYYIFDPVTKLLKEVQDEYGNKNIIRYTEGSEKKIACVEDAVGRKFKFTYNSSGYLTRIDCPKGYISYTYTNGYLRTITDPSNRVLTLTTENGLLKKADPSKDSYIDGVTYYYKTVSGKTVVSGVICTSTESEAIDIGIIYEGKNVTTYTPYSGAEKFRTCYRLDEDNTIKDSYSYDAENGVLYLGGVYNDGVGTGSGQSTNHYVDNLLNGRSVFWYNCSEKYDDDSVFGRSYRLEASSSKPNVGMYKETKILPAGEYTVSAFVKTAGVLQTTTGGVRIRVVGAADDSSYIDCCNSALVCDSHDEFVRIEHSFKLTQAKAVTVYVELINGLNGDGALINALQIEKGNCASALNIILNSGFERTDENGALYGWKSGSRTDDGRVTPATGNCVYQTIKVKSSADKLESFMLSGFAKGNTSIVDDTHKFELRAEIFYEKDENESELPADANADETYQVSFDPNRSDWQLKSVSFEKNAYRPIAYIRICLDCEGQSNFDVCFDNVQLSLTSYKKVGISYFDNSFSNEETEENTTNSVPEGRKDAYGNVLGTISDGGYQALYTSTDYSENGNDIIAVADERLNKTLYEVDEKTSHLLKEYAPGRSGVEYTYQPGSDNLTSVKTTVNGETIETSYGYSSGNLTSILTPTANYTLEYERGNIKTIKVGNASLVSYTYNENSGRVKTAAYPDGSVMSCSYDRFGKVIAETWTKNGTTTAEYGYTYDHDGNLVRSFDYGRGVMYSYSYNNGELQESRECKIKKNASGVWCRVEAATSCECHDYVVKSDGVITSDDIKITNGSDGLGRNDYREVRLGNTKLVTEKYSYHKGDADAHSFEKMSGAATTSLVSAIEYSTGNKSEYEYDESGNITKVCENGVVTAQYAYDELGRLIREDNRTAEKTVLYTYDKGGNILTKNRYAFTLNTPGTLKQSNTYTYDTDDSTWKDRLKKYSGYGDTMSYVGGNPNSYHGYTLTWEKGRQLKAMTKSGSNLSFEYNASGVRTKKTADGIVHNYYLNGMNILFETIEREATVDVLEYICDENGNTAGVKYNEEVYLYEKNLQGDVIRLLDKDGEVVVKYVYDAWGKIEKVTDANGADLSSNPTHITNVNPIRYRSYYYDTETQLYYLQSRYYDPETGRFVNADDAEYIISDKVIFNNNLFSYCGDNPISRIDYKGRFWFTLIVAVTALVYLGNNLVHSVYNQSKAPTGYIYNQTEGAASKLWFGFFRSSYNGCGWIATYNATIMLGKRISPDDIIGEYELTGAVVCGVFGIQPYAITHFFRFRKYKVTVTYNSSQFDKVAKRNTANIIWFWHSKGAHYVALRWDGKKFVGYNTFSNSTGPDNWGNSIPSFLKRHNYKATLLISISR